MIIAIFWLVVIGGFIGYKEYNLQTGTQIVLATVPVDPYDLFRGDYVILKYDISEMQVPNDQYEAGDSIYVKLEEELPVGLTRGIGVSKEKPTGLFIEGRIIDIRESTHENKDENGEPTYSLQTDATIEYGIESYFVPEGRGYELEELRGNELTVRVSVNGKGKAIIKDLLKNGEKVLFNKPL